MEEFNKRRLLQYEEYKQCFTIKICGSNGNVIRRNFMTDVNIKYTEPIRIGIDQSSSQTGVAVKKKKTGELLCLIDFVNESRLNFGLYKAMLGLKIEQIFQNTNVEMCILEKMWGGNKNSYEMLTSLADYISGFKYILPGWSRAEVATILPNVWRSSYLAGKEYKGMHTKDKVKVAAMLEGIKRYPFLYNYGHFNKEGNHVNDSFDALGILEGYEDKTFSSDGSIRKVSNTMSPTNHEYNYILLTPKDKDCVVSEIQKHCPDRIAVEYEYNSDFPFYENILRATSVTNKIVYMNILDDVAKIQLMWRYGCVINRNSNVYLVGWRNRVSSKLDNY